MDTSGRVASTHSLEDLLREKETVVSGDTHGSDKRSSNKATLLGCIVIGSGLVVCSAFLLIMVLFCAVSCDCTQYVVRLRDGLKLNYPGHFDYYYYYIVMVPLLLPVTVAYIAANWFSMKIFKHNSVSAVSG